MFGKSLICFNSTAVQGNVLVYPYNIVLLFAVFSFLMAVTMTKMLNNNWTTTIWLSLNVLIYYTENSFHSMTLVIRRNWSIPFQMIPSGKWDGFQGKCWGSRWFVGSKSWTEYICVINAASRRLTDSSVPVSRGHYRWNQQNGLLSYWIRWKWYWRQTNYQHSAFPSFAYSKQFTQDLERVWRRGYWQRAVQWTKSPPGLQSAISSSRWCTRRWCNDQ